MMRKKRKNEVMLFILWLGCLSCIVSGYPWKKKTEEKLREVVTKEEREVEICNPPCLNGECSNGTCYCEPNWVGDVCNGCTQMSKCGICGISDDECPCAEGFSGPNCNIISPCYNMQCLHGGMCNTNTGLCDCPPEYMGLFCDKPSCSGHGVWNTEMNQCTCKFGWTGESCSACLIISGDSKINLCVQRKGEQEVVYSLVQISDKYEKQWRAGNYSTYFPFVGPALYPGTFISDDKGRLDCTCHLTGRIVVEQQTKALTKSHLQTGYSSEQLFDICAHFLQDETEQTEQLFQVLETCDENTDSEDTCSNTVASVWMVLSLITFIVIILLIVIIFILSMWLIDYYQKLKKEQRKTT
jgi:hypothetical protein